MIRVHEYQEILESGSTQERIINYDGTWGDYCLLYSTYDGSPVNYCCGDNGELEGHSLGRNLKFQSLTITNEQIKALVDVYGNIYSVHIIATLM